MTTLLLAAILLTLLGLHFARSGYRRLIGSRVVLHTKDDRSLQGVLVAAHRDSLTLADATYLDEAQPVEGLARVGVPRANLAWHQEL